MACLAVNLYLQCVAQSQQHSLECSACNTTQSTEQVYIGFKMVQVLVREAETHSLCRILRVPFKKKNGEVLQKWVSR